MTSVGQRRWIGISLLFVTPLSGCITATGMTIGTRVERIHSIQRAVQNDDQLVIDYQVILLKAGAALFWADEVITRDARGWSAIDLRGMDWQDLENYSPVPGEMPQGAGTARLELGPRPDTPLPPFEDVPLLSEARAILYAQALRDAGVSHPLSVCCSGSPAPVLGGQELVLLAQNGEPDGHFRFAMVQIPELRHETWWAIPARIAIFPLTLAADIVTLPAQVCLVLLLRGVGRMG
jgi:hypothetical protein